MEAKLYKKLEKMKVQCTLCPHNCIISEDRRGACRVRLNKGGKLIAETYQKYSALGFDPIEKKPIYHFYPGKQILSVGSVGCNMKCKWCQNCEISQVGIEAERNLRSISNEEIVQLALQREDNIGIAFTYNEPSIAFESVIETAALSKKNNLVNVFVSNGYIGGEAMEAYLELIDAFNIDVKAFDEHVYEKYTGSGLKPVLNSLKQIVKKGRHLEVTFLLVPGVNGNIEKFKEFVNWYSDNLGVESVLHISRYFPRHRMTAEATQLELLEAFADIASSKLKFVFAGNYTSNRYSHTVCPDCSTIVIHRTGYSVSVSGAQYNGNCPNCGREIYKCQM